MPTPYDRNSEPHAEIDLRWLTAIALILILLTSALPGCKKADPGSDGDAGAANGAADSREGATDRSTDDAETVAVERSGAELYAEHCAQCHGITGDGTPEIELAVKPRNFAEGGFAFGDTREALYKVVTDGLPGNSLMIAYKAILTDAERWRVVDHVRTLMPERESVPAQDRKMVVGDRAQFVRGHLRPVREGLPMQPNGLLVGLPGGLSLEYRTDDVRLLALRNGEFVDRTDWDGRGGSPLAPLGEILSLVDQGNPEAMFWLGDTGLSARLRSTRVNGTDALLSYALLDDSGAEIARVRETLRAGPQLEGRPTLERVIDVEPTGDPALHFALASGAAEFERRPDDALDKAGWFVQSDGGSAFTYMLVQADGVTNPSNRNRIDLSTGVPTLQIKIHLVATDSWTEERLATWKGVLDA